MRPQCSDHSLETPLQKYFEVITRALDLIFADCYINRYMHTQLHLMGRVNVHQCMFAAYRFTQRFKHLLLEASKPLDYLDSDAEVMCFDRWDWFVEMENDIKDKHTLIKKKKENES